MAPFSAALLVLLVLDWLDALLEWPFEHSILNNFPYGKLSLK
jgi:hypothetical protein